MTSSASLKPSLHLVQRLADGSVRFIALTDGAAVAASAGASYALLDQASGKSPEGLRLKRKGDALVVERDDGGELVQIDGFYQHDDVAFIADATLDGNRLGGAEAEADLTVADTTVSADTKLGGNAGDDQDTGAAWTPMDAVLAGVGFGAVGLLARSTRADGDSWGEPAAPVEPEVNNTVQGTIVGGPVVDTNDLRVEVYAADGVTLLGEAAVNADGTFSIAVGDYQGVVIARVVNTGSGADYLDEATDAAKDLNAALFAIEVVDEPNSTVTININALTTLAYHKAVEAAGDAAPGAELVNTTNAAIAGAFGINSLHQTAVVPLNGGSYNSGDGLSAGEQYGAVLAALSGADAENGGDSQQTIDDLVAGITISGGGVATLDASAQTIVVDGAERTQAETGEDLTDGVVVVVDTLAPAITSGATATAIDENSGAGQVVYTATATDAASVTYSLAAGDDAALFSIDSSSGAVTLTGNPDFETQASYSFTVVATDAAGNSGMQTVTLAVNDLDEVAPTVTSVTVPGNDTYVAGDTLSFTINTSEAVTVNTTGGTPRIALTIGGSTVYADYASGSGSSALVFEYTVQAGDVDADGIAVGALGANGGTLQDATGNNLVTTLNSVGSTASVLVDAAAPTVSSVSVPSNDTYVAGDTLSFTINTSEAVTVNTTGGTPQIALTIGGSTVYADYVSGSGSSALVFEYTVQAGDVDADGIAVGALSANGGTLQDATGNNLVTTLNSVGSTTSVLVDAVAPTVSSVSVPSNDTYVAGDTLSFTVNTSEAVTVDTTGGTPRIALTVGSSTVYADYVSGSGTSALVFEYTVQAGDLDANGIAVGALSANGGSLQDAAGNSLTTTLNSVGSTASVLVDAVAPTVSSVSVPANDTYVAGDTLQFTVNTSEAVTVDTTGGTPRIALTVGSSTVYADYVSGSGTSALVFEYTVQAGDLDANGIAVGALSANGGSLQDAAGNSLTTTLNSVGSTASVLVDAVAPTVTSVSVPANDTYVEGQFLEFTVNTSEIVTVDTNSGSTVPRIALTIGGSTVYADFASGSGTSALLFVYEVQGGDLDADGISVGALDLNGGSISDAASNALNTTLNSVGSTASVLVDAVAPTVSSVSVPANDTYVAGDTLTFTVNTSENVTVNTTGGTPQLALTIGASTVYAAYASGSGTGALVFEYTVQAGDEDANGIAVGALSANGGTLQDAAGNNLVTTLNAVGDTGSVLVDAVAPTLSSSVPADNGNLAPAGNIVLTFSEDVLAGSGNIVISNGTDTRNIAVTDNTQVTITGNTVTINPTADLDLDSTYYVQMASGVLTDAAGNPYAGIADTTTLNFSTVDTSIVVFDLLEGVSSSHSSRTFDADTSYTIYIRVDSTSGVLSTDGTSSNMDADWGTWSGASNLGADDRIVLVGSGSAVQGAHGDIMTVFAGGNYLWWIALDAGFSMRNSGQVSRDYQHMTISVLDLWAGTWAARPDAGGFSIGNNLLTAMPAGILTSQGLA